MKERKEYYFWWPCMCIEFRPLIFYFIGVFLKIKIWNLFSPRKIYHHIIIFSLYFKRIHLSIIEVDKIHFSWLIINLLAFIYTDIILTLNSSTWSCTFAEKRIDILQLPPLLKRRCLSLWLDKCWKEFSRSLYLFYQNSDSYTIFFNTTILERDQLHTAWTS